MSSARSSVAAVSSALIRAAPNTFPRFSSFFSLALNRATAHPKKSAQTLVFWGVDQITQRSRNPATAVRFFGGSFLVSRGQTHKCGEDEV